MMQRDSKQGQRERGNANAQVGDSGENFDVMRAHIHKLAC